MSCGIITYGQMIMIIGGSLIFAPYFYMVDKSYYNLYKQLLYFIVSLIGIVPGIILLIIGAIIYVGEWLCFLIAQIPAPT